MKYTLRQLEVFLAVSHHENVTRAAEALAMSQSAASGALKDLEIQFGIQLFDRVGKRLQANELGRRLRPRAESLLAQAQALEHALEAHDEIGEISVGATLTIGNYLAIGMIDQYMQLSPNAKVHLNVANTETIVREILNFDLDLGLIEGEFQHPDLEIRDWREDELICFCAPSHPFAGRPFLRDADLLEANWILREAGSGTRQAFDRAMHGLTPHLHISLELQHTEAIKRATEAGLGIACLSKITLQEAFARGSLLPLPVDHRDFRRQFYLILHKEKYLSAGIEAWMKICGLETLT